LLRGGKTKIQQTWKDPHDMLHAEAEIVIQPPQHVDEKTRQFHKPFAIATSAAGFENEGLFG
jgi:hypothetical protein